MNYKLELAQNRLIERIGKMCNQFGLNPFVAELFIVLYLSEKVLSLDDLARLLKVSKGNVCINIRELERWGAVRKVWIRGSRKDFYEAEADLKKVFTEKLKSSLKKYINEISEMCAEFKRAVAIDPKELSAEERGMVGGYKERIKNIEKLNNTISIMFKLAAKFL